MCARVRLRVLWGFYLKNALCTAKGECLARMNGTPRLYQHNVPCLITIAAQTLSVMLFLVLVHTKLKKNDKTQISEL